MGIHRAVVESATGKTVNRTASSPIMGVSFILSFGSKSNDITYHAAVGNPMGHGHAYYLRVPCNLLTSGRVAMVTEMGYPSSHGGRSMYMSYAVSYTPPISRYISASPSPRSWVASSRGPRSRAHRKKADLAQRRVESDIVLIM